MEIFIETQYETQCESEHELQYEENSEVSFNKSKIKNFKKKRNGYRRRLLTELIEHNLLLPKLQENHDIMISYMDIYIKELNDKHISEKQRLNDEWINFQNIIGPYATLSELEIQLKIRQEENLKNKQLKEYNGFQKIWYDTNNKIIDNWNKYYQHINELKNKLEYFYPPTNYIE